MKILIASDTYYPHTNGASYSTQRFAHALADRGHEVVVLAPSKTFFHEEETHGKIKVHGIRSFPIFFYPGQFRFTLGPLANRHIKKVMRAYQPDIVHIQMHFAISSAALAAARHQSIPVVATNHFMPENLVHYIPLPRFLRKIIVALAWKDATRVYRKTYMVVSPTETARQLLSRWFDKATSVISNGVELERFHPYHKTDAVREKYQLPRKPLLLFVGRLDKEKNIDVVIRAASRALKHTDFNIIIAGTGTERKNLEHLVKSLGITNHVIFTGFVPDEELPKLYAASDCFVNAGIAELQGMSVMEAMASGLPILAANAVALPELVHHEENGFLFEPGDIDTLARHLVTIFRDEKLRKKMGGESLKIINPHNLRDMVVAFENLYKKIREEFIEMKRVT